MQRFSISHDKAISIKPSLVQLFLSLTNSNPNSTLSPAPCMLNSQQATRRSTPVWLSHCGDKHNSRLVFGIRLVKDTSQPEWEHRGSVLHWLLAKTDGNIGESQRKLESMFRGGISVFSQPILSYISNEPASLCPAVRVSLPNNSSFTICLGACKHGGKLEGLYRLLCDPKGVKSNWRMPAWVV